MTAPTPRETADHAPDSGKMVQTPMHRDAAKATLALSGTADHAELAACPFCGGDPFDCGFRRWECGLCGAKGPAGRKNDATSGWNSRAGEAALLSEIAALRGAKWDVQHADTMNDMVLMGMARDEAIDRATQAERQRDELRKALEPFAKAAGKLDGLWSEDDWRWNDSVRSGVTVRDIRRASKVLANQGADQ